MAPLEIDVGTARRYVLGRQGLWPGRRWRRADGLLRAVREVAAVQVDPLEVVAQNQHLVLASRVLGYRPRDLERALYQDRALFEWGGNLQIRPTDELPFYRSKIVAADYLGRRARFEHDHPEAIARVLREVERRGPLGSRDFEPAPSVASYRARQETGLALYYLWLRGDLMIQGRVRGERRYDLARRLLAPRLLRPAPAPVARRFRMRRGLRLFGLPNRSEMLAVQKLSSDDDVRVGSRAGWIEEQERAGEVVRLKVHGWPGPHWVAAEDVPLFEGLGRGDAPPGWRPVGPTTEEEATFLAPLEIVSARGRARRLFGFDYVWEVYKPPSRRKWGYYTLPVLHGERLRARADLRLDRETSTLRLLGFWFEDPNDGADARFAGAVGRGLRRLAGVADAASVDVRSLRPKSFRETVAREA